MTSENFLWASELGPCFECGQTSQTVEINFQAYLHEECEAAADRRYWEAVKRD